MERPLGIDALEELAASGIINADIGAMSWAFNLMQT